MSSMKEENKIEYQVYLTKESIELRERMNKLKHAGHPLLISLLNFMSLCPGGICLTELRLIGKKIVAEGFGIIVSEDSNIIC